ncbi:MAG: hypothetical protein NTY09_08265 [bacterium]|nr:hypothetical protein [bacterium]
MKKFPHVLITALALAMLALIAGGIWFYRSQERHIRQGIESNLNSIAELKVSQIATYREDRIEDASVIMNNAAFAEEIENWMANGQTTDYENILTYFRSFQTYFDYFDVLLVDPDGKVLISILDFSSPLHNVAQGAIDTAIGEHRAILTDLHEGPNGLPIHIDSIAPIFVGDGASSHAIGAVVLQSDATEYLYPLIQSWPTPSATAETLLVRKDGDSVLYLNELRHQQNTALELRILLTQTDQPAVMAVNGTEGYFEGKDYRGVDVLSVLKPIPD